MDYFEKFFENIIQKRLDRNLQPELKFPRLITQLLESKGYLVPSEEEKVEVKNVYRVEDWRKTINRSRVILQNSTTFVQQIPPTKEPHPILQSQPLVGSYLNEEGRQSVERLMGQAALAERHSKVALETTTKTSKELDRGGIGVELGNQSPLLTTEIENDVCWPKVRSPLPGFDSEVCLHTQVEEEQPSSTERPTIPTQERTSPHKLKERVSPQQELIDFLRGEFNEMRECIDHV